MKQSGRTSFVSDVHLGLQVCDPAGRERRFADFLRALPEDTEALYLLGDIWDFWYEYRDVVPKGYVRVFSALQDLMDRGVKVFFFEGTHDIWTYSYFEELGISPELYILGMCRFVPEKNLHHLIEAYVAYKKRHPESKIRLVLAGDADFEDDYSRRLKKMAKENGVVLTGFVRGEKLQSLLTHASCYVLPSSHEGLPIALLEAMSYDLPVVVSDIPANLEIGLPLDSYFHVGEIQQLADKIEKLLEECTNYRIQYDMSKYQWEHIANQVCEVYKLLEAK